MTEPLLAARRWLSEQSHEMTQLLSELVAIDSPSHQPQAVARVRDHLAGFLRAHGVDTARIASADGAAECLLAQTQAAQGPASNAPSVLLMGHLDTVFGPDEARRRPFTIRNGIAYGPGVADMKAGVVMNAFIMAALARFALPYRVQALFTVDEEIGSPASRSVIEATARGQDYVFNSEPGRVNGNVVDGRRGGAFYRVVLTGKAAHAGLNPQDGRSAVLELAHKILAWDGLNAPDAGISVSVGVISGGLAVNMIAPIAEARIDLRFGTVESGEAAERELRRIAEQAHVSGVTAQFEVLGKFLPMSASHRSEALTRAYLQSAQDLQITAADGGPIHAEFTPSCSDAGLTASLGIATLCAVGPVGGKAHSPEEYLHLDTMVPRALAILETLPKLELA